MKIIGSIFYFYSSGKWDEVRNLLCGGEGWEEGGGERVRDIKTRELVEGGERAANVPPPTPFPHSYYSF